jgi:N-acyl homoserine lactone hydrolase
MSSDTHESSQPTARAEFTAGGKPVVVHALQTGTVTIKRCHHTCCLPERAPMAARFAAILADRRFANPMPIWTYAIEHPDGLFVVDAGAEPGYNDRSTWGQDQSTRRVLQSFIRLTVTENETLPARLVQVGLDSSAVKAVVLTHQQIDHTATVPAFPDADIWTTDVEDRAQQITGACHFRWRNASTRIRYVDTSGRAGDFGPTVDLTSDGILQAIHTPGHTPGSVSVLLQTDQGEVWFTGDTSFTAATMDPKAPTAGIHTDMTSVRQLQTRLKDRWLLLPSHDWTVPQRLAMIEPVETVSLRQPVRTRRPPKGGRDHRHGGRH